MTRHLIFAVAALLLLPLVAPDAAAQVQSPLSLEASAGLGWGTAQGDYTGERRGIAGDLLIGARLGDIASGSLVGALAVGANGAGAATGACIPVVGGGCLSRFPSFFSVAPLVGWEPGRGAHRFMVGPAIVQDSYDNRSIGVQGRYDVVATSVQRIAVLLSVRSTYLPNHRGDAVGLMAAGLGLRLR